MKKTSVKDIMTRDVEAASVGADIRQVFQIMKRERVRRVPVIDDSGRLVGIIAQADLAVDYAGLDEERGLEVGEVLERISEPAEPARWMGRPRPSGGPREWFDAGRFGDFEEDLRDRFRDGWRRVRHEARHLMNRGYDRGWR